MARKKKQTPAEKLEQAANIVSLFESDELEDDDGEDSQLRDDVLDDLAKIDEQHAGGISWELVCDLPLDKRGMIRKLARSELVTLRDECLALGPGEYHVIARLPSGKFVKDSRRNFKISGLARGPTAPAAPATQFDPTAFLAQIEQRERERRDEAKRERMHQLRFWAPIAAPIVAEFVKGMVSRPAGEKLSELIAAFVGLKDLSGGGDKQIETLLKGMELQRELTPEGPQKGSTWPDVLVNGVTTIAREFRPLAETLAQRRNGQAPAQASPAPQLHFAPKPNTTTTAAEPAPAGSSPPAGEDDMLAMFDPLLRKLAGELYDFAANAAEPGLTADALLAKVPRIVKTQVSSDQVKEWLNSPDWWQVLVKYHPPLEPYAAFCDDVRQELIAIVSGETEGEAEESGDEKQPT